MSNELKKIIVDETEYDLKNNTINKIIVDGVVYNLPVGSSDSSLEVIEVDEFPTENIDENAIYKINKVTDLGVWIKESPTSAYSLDEAIQALNPNSNITYYLVDTLPSSPNISDLGTFSIAHIYIYNDVPYIYGNAGSGNMWLELSLLFSQLAGVEIPNKGYTDDPNLVSEGINVTYKKASLGLPKNIGYYTYNGIWSNYKNIFNRTITEYVDSDIEVIPNYALCHQTNLSSIDLPNTVYIDDYAFAECSNLTNVTLPKVVTIGFHAFEKCSNLISFKNVPMLQKIGSSAFINCTNLEDVIIDNVTEIISNAFEGCTNLKNISMNNVEVIGYGAFKKCGFSNIYTPNLKSIDGSVFSGCPNLTTVNMSISKVELTGDSIFENCSNLTSVYMDTDSDVPSRIFYNCTKLSRIPSFHPSIIGSYAFNGCSSLSSFGGIFNSVNEIGISAFRSCTNLKNVEAYHLHTIESSAFAGCTSLSTVRINRSVDIFTKPVNIGSSAFSGCTSLTEFECNRYNNERAIGTIGEYAFYGCTSLTTIHLDGVTSIGNYAFSGCSNLTTVILDSSTFITYSFTIFNSTPMSTSGTLYVPDTLVNRYTSDYSWKSAMYQIKPLSELQE